MSRPTNAAIVDLKGRTWQPFETTSPTGHVTYSETEGEIHVPYGTDPVSLTIQAHELAHVRYSAKVWPDIKVMLPQLTKLAGTTNSIVGYAEDMRITALAGRLGIKTLPVFGVEVDKPIIDGWVKSFVDAGVPEDRVQRAVRFILNEHTSVLDSIGLDLATLQQKKNAEAYITHCARYIHELLSRGKADEPDSGDKGDSRDKGKGDPSPGDSGGEARDEPSEPQDGEDGEDGEDGDSSDGEAGDDESKDGKAESKSESKSDGTSADKGKGKDKDKPKSDAKPGKPSKGTPSKGDADGVSDAEIDLSRLKLPDIRQSMLKSVPAPVDTEKLIQNFQHTLDKANWIPVAKIDRMPLVRRAAQATRKGRKLSETGVALGSAYDAVAPNERRPFLSKRRGGTGGLTVVIDCSGSMNIDEHQLEQLLLKYPQGVVVTYSSHVRHDDQRAVVRVIASHGRLAATQDFRDNHAGGNGCDGPILEWLAKQSGERVWVCDGIITEREDILVTYDYGARDAWLKAHRITRFPNLDWYLESLSKR